MKNSDWEIMVVPSTDLATIAQAHIEASEAMDNDALLIYAKARMEYHMDRVLPESEPVNVNSLGHIGATVLWGAIGIGMRFPLVHSMKRTGDRLKRQLETERPDIAAKFRFGTSMEQYLLTEAAAHEVLRGRNESGLN